MARLSESPAHGTQSVKKQQVTLKNSALAGFLSSPAKPSGSQSPHPNKRLKSLAAAGSPRSDASRSHSPPSQRLSSQVPLSSPARKTFSDTAADDMDTTELSTLAADTVAAAAAAAPAETTRTSTPPVPTAVMGPAPDADMAATTPESSTARPGVLSSVRKTFASAVNNLTGPRNGTVTVTTTFEKTVVSRKRSREPESEDPPAPADKEDKEDKEAEDEVEPANITTDINDTTIQLGNQFEAETAAEEERAKSPEKNVAQVTPSTSPAGDNGEINVTTAANNSDTIEAAETTKSADAAEKEDEDMDDPKNGVFVLEDIIGHRCDPNDKTLFQMHVCWTHDKPTWEPEQNIQEDADEALFKYWGTVKGGRLGAMADKNLWHVLRVEKHRQRPNGAVQLLVYWIGSPDRSWEPEHQVEQYARQHVADYWAAKGGREKHVKAIAVPAKKGRGRPRKNPVAEEAPKEKKARQGRKKLSDGAAEPEAEKAEATQTKEAAGGAAGEQVEADSEPPKKRGRGRPRKNPVS